MRTTHFVMAPRVLVLESQRLQYDAKSGSCCKLQTHQRVEEHLNVTHLQAPGGAGVLQYRLASLVVHHGAGSDSGARVAQGGWHYTAAVRGPNGGWLHVDDSHVSTLPKGVEGWGAACTGGYMSVYVLEE